MNYDSLINKINSLTNKSMMNWILLPNVGRSFNNNNNNNNVLYV